MNKSVEEYSDNNGWSSSLFAKEAVDFLKQLKQNQEIQIDIGRTVIKITMALVILKCYVHYKGRTKEFATVTDNKGTALFSAHYTEFWKLKEHILCVLSSHKML